MAKCGRCGVTLQEGTLSCPECGGTAIPASVERVLQPLLRQGDLLEGRFRIETVLGSGASGVVYGARDLLREGRVALKVLWESAAQDDPAFQRLRREIATSQQAPDPRLASIYDIMILQGHPALVMEWVEGETLRDLIRREGALSPAQAEHVAAEILSGLAHLHELGIVHRDVKSGNILLAASGGPKLGDFGLAKGESLGSTLTETGVALGTPGYMAPEVIRGDAATPASDRYSLGVVLFEMLTGRLPYQGSSALEVASRQLSESPPLHLLKDKRIPRWLAAFTGRLLERDPADRFHSTKDALAALRRKRAWLVPTRRGKRLLAAGVFVVLACTAGALLWNRLAPPARLVLSYQGKVLEVRDAGGKLLWSRTLPQAIQSAVEGRFGPGGSRAVACAIQWDPESTSPYNTNKILAFTPEGAALATLEVSAQSNRYSKRYAVQLESHRFSAASGEQLVAYARHTTWYPAALTVYTQDALRPTLLPVLGTDLTFNNSGNIGRFIYSDVDGDGVDEVVCAGINNRLYRMLFATVLHLDRGASTAETSALSPDIAWTHDPRMRYYRLFESNAYVGLTLEPGARGGLPTIRLPPRRTIWEVAADGLRSDGVPTPPDAAVVERANGAMARLCALRDRGEYGALERACADWPAVRAEPYAWLGKLFLANALLGQGRYDECSRLLREGISSPGEGRLPLYAYQFWADAAFLAGDYDECLRRVETIPRWESLARPEIGHTALWAAIYAGDPDVRGHVLGNPSLSFFEWYPKMFEGALALLAGRPQEAEGLLRAASRDFDASGDIRFWLARALAAQGRFGEAASLVRATAAAYPDEGADRSLLELEADYLGGDRRAEIVRQADERLASLRQDAVASVDTRANLPLELASAARIHRAAGDRAKAKMLMEEAVRSSPRSWRQALALP